MHKAVVVILLWVLRAYWQSVISAATGWMMGNICMCFYDWCPSMQHVIWPPYTSQMPTQCSWDLPSDGESTILASFLYHNGSQSGLLVCEARTTIPTIQHTSCFLLNPGEIRQEMLRWEMQWFDMGKNYSLWGQQYLCVPASDHVR